MKKDRGEGSDFSWIRVAGAFLAFAAALSAAGLAVAGEGMEPAQFAISVLCGAAAGLFVLFRVRCGRLLSWALALLLPAAAFFALENYTHVITDLTLPIVFLNLLFFYLLYGLLAFLCGSVAVGYGIATLVPMLFGLANYFVVSFRSSPIVPWDFLSIGTAAAVAGNYSFTLQWKQAFVLLLFLWIIVLASGTTLRVRRRPARAAGALAFALGLGIAVSGIQNAEVQKFFGMDNVLFTLNVLYRNNGIAAAFLGNLRFLHIEEPDGYSPGRAQEIEEAYVPSDAPRPIQKLPNVIVIMDEAFSDLSVWGEFETSEEVMPFFRMMQEEAVGGELYVSVKGGNTANTEFEFLTGDTMGFLPTGCIPYQQYINSALPSMVGSLNALGYRTTAVHPYNASGWDRDEVYSQFGFDEFLSLKDFVAPHKMRGYVSDRATFDRVIEEYEKKGDEERDFFFVVTMQNHGGYSKASPDFESYLKLTGVENKTTSVLATEKYLTLMNETDCALQDLLLYFMEQEEPTIVAMFGDHQPSDYITNVIRRICGVEEKETLDFVQQGYRVPFLIWSNYGLEHEYYDGISVNYLGGILMEKAGIPLTGYQMFLEELREKFPVVSGNVYRDDTGTFHSYGEDAMEEQLDGYRILQYSQLVDQKHRNDSFFQLQ